MADWYYDALNGEHVGRLRANLADGGRLLVFLGAGLSFGSARLGARATFDNEQWGIYPSHKKPPFKKDHDRDLGGPPYPPFGPFVDFAKDDDDLPLPSWPWLISRMRRHLAQRCDDGEQKALSKFFRDEGPLDCAQLFKQTVGSSNYREFLQEQFDIRRHPVSRRRPRTKPLSPWDCR